MKNPVTATYFECIGLLNFLRDLHGSSDYQKVLLYNYLFPLNSSVGGGGGAEASSDIQNMKWSNYS